MNLWRNINLIENQLIYMASLILEAATKMFIYMEYWQHEHKIH